MCYGMRLELTDIQQIINAVNGAYGEFTASSPAREIRTAVSNAVKFMVADLRSIESSATRSPEFWGER